MLFITKKATDKIIEITNKENILPIIKIGIKSFGCNGFGFSFSFIKEDKIKETDTVFEQNNIKFIIDNKSIVYINGTIIDFTNNLLNPGFIFKNDKYKNKCGCGKSFEL